MKFLQFGNKFLNIDYIILIEDYNTTYPNTSTIIYYQTNGNTDGYFVLPLGYDEVIKLLKE